MNCDLCKSELVPVFPDLNRRRDDDQWSGCLHIVLDGGYGEYVDAIAGSTHYRLCKTCASGLLEREAWIWPDGGS